MAIRTGTAWPEISLTVNIQQAQKVERALLKLGALSITYLDKGDRPVLEPAPGEVRLWDKMRLLALFAQNRDEQELTDSVCKALGVSKLPENAFKKVPDQQWEKVWMDQFQPMRFGQRLWICPTHEKPVDDTAINLWLDPGLAFGTGTHATTALCLEWLESAQITGKSMIDFGCGSGVLSIAALLLGANKIYATDIDPQAMLASEENARLNKVLGQLHLVSQEELVDNQCEILVANILFQPIIDLKEVFTGLVIGTGTIVLSGILEEQVPALINRYKESFKFLDISVRDGWARVSGIRIP